jgi:hypothetical protein
VATEPIVVAEVDLAHAPDPERAEHTVRSNDGSGGNQHAMVDPTSSMGRPMTLCSVRNVSRSPASWNTWTYVFKQGRCQDFRQKDWARRGKRIAASTIRI